MTIDARADRESVTAPPVLPLCSGDRLTRAEFEQRYSAAPRELKAELIEGVVYVASRVRFTQHGNPHARLIGWLEAYCVRTPGVDSGDNATLRSDNDNEPQPDALLRLIEGGGSQVDDEGYLTGAPELIAEVAASSASYDLHDKLRVYRRIGVREYLVWRVFDRAIDWFVLRAGRYVRLAPGPDGVLRSEVFPGLALDAAALLAGDRPGVADTLRRELESPEHARFVASLTAAQRPPP